MAYELGGELLAATFAHDEAGLRVLALHPNQVAAARARFRVSGGKSDRFDAFVICELARTDHHRFRASVDPRERSLSVQSVEAVVARVQDLVDSRPPGEYPLDWCVEASYLGDLNAIGAVAAVVGRSTQK